MDLKTNLYCIYIFKAQEKDISILYCFINTFVT